MKNQRNNLKTRFNRSVIRLQLSVRQKLQETDGNFVMDHAVVFVIIVVLGGIVLTLLTKYLNDDLSSTLKTKINDFFN
ncbi:MAG: hypothetical protein VB071_12305 [Lawsonibacter sp.]|nr:hypothetical protein [Lawsonibacter sp.]